METEQSKPPKNGAPMVVLGNDIFAVFCCTDYGRSLIFFRDKSVIKPMVGNKDQILSLLPTAQKICNRAGQKFKIYRFNSKQLQIYGEEITIGDLK